MIARKTPLRRSPLVRKPKKRKSLFKTMRCNVRGCTRKAEVKWSVGSKDVSGITAGHSIEVTYTGMCKSHARAEADRRFSLFIRARDGKCMRCGATEGLQCAHIISRRYLATRWNDENAIAFCLRCHKWQTERPLEGEEWFEKFLLPLGPRVTYRTLRESALHGEPMSLAEVLGRYAQP